MVKISWTWILFVSYMSLLHTVSSTTLFVQMTERDEWVLSWAVFETGSVTFSSKVWLVKKYIFGTIVLSRLFFFLFLTYIYCNGVIKWVGHCATVVISLKTIRNHHYIQKTILSWTTRSTTIWLVDNIIIIQFYVLKPIYYIKRVFS